MMNNLNSATIVNEKNPLNQEKEGYKKTKLGWIPEDWRVERLGEFISVFSGGTPTSTNKKFYSEKSGYPWITSGFLNSVTILKTETFLTEEGLKNSSAKLIQPETLLLALYGATAGVVAISKIQGAINQAILAIKCLKGLERDYLAYFLKHNKQRYVLKFTQGGQPNLSAKNVKGYQIPLPPIQEQQKIAQILTTWDEAITKTEQLISKKQKRKKGLMQQLLSGQNQFKLFKNEDLQLIEFGKLVVRSKSKHDPKKINRYLPCIELEHLDQGTGKLLGYKDSRNQSSIKNHFFKGEVLFGKLRPYLKKYLQAGFEGVCSSEIWVLKAKDIKRLNNDYLFYLVQSHHFIEACKATTGSKMPRADWEYISEFPFHFPSLKKQKFIANILSKADQEIFYLQNQLSKLNEQKKGLMQKLLTGEVRVKLK